MNDTEKPKPYTRAEIIKWPALGPMNLDMYRMLATVESREALQQELEEAKATLVFAEAHPAAGLAEES